VDIASMRLPVHPESARITTSSRISSVFYEAGSGTCVQPLVGTEAAKKITLREEVSMSNGHGETPGIVIAGLVLAFLCPLVGLILCIIGMDKARQARSGEGLAKLGIGISIGMMVLGILLRMGGVA
jgi:hypothetical protein